MDTFLQEVRFSLTSHILPYWLRLKDPRGGFFGEVQSDGTVQPDAPRGVILNARLVWSFAAAYAALKDEQYLEAAVYARDWFLDHFFDPQYGGVYWSVSFGGGALAPAGGDADYGSFRPSAAVFPAGLDGDSRRHFLWP